MKSLRTACIIDNYNHARFVVEAVESALGQSATFDEIIVVDDASTDDSQRTLKEAFEFDTSVRLIFREVNGGQLACLQTGIMAAESDVCCLLDADDTLASNYMEQVISVYDSRPQVDAVFVGCRELQTVIEKGLVPEREQQTGLSPAIAWLLSAWIGGPTSSLSFRKSALEQIFPYDFTSDWKVRADDYLNIASSMTGCVKYYLPQHLVHFRWHDRNQSRTCADSLSTYKRRIALNRLKEVFRQRMQLDLARLADDLHREFATWPQPSFQLLKWYMRATFTYRRSFIRAVAQSFSMSHHFIQASVLGRKPPNTALSQTPPVKAEDFPHGQVSSRRVA